jgi:hypothetical protein
MNKEPDNRYQTAGEMAEAVRPFAAQDVAFQGLAAARPAFDTDAGSTAPGMTRRGQTGMGWTATGEAPPKGKSTGLIVGAILGLLLLLGGGTVATLFGLGIIGGEKPSTQASVPIVSPQDRLKDGGPKVETIEFIVAASPETAGIYLDGGELDGNPVKLNLEKSSGSKLLEVRAEGFENYKEWIRLDADFSRTITLKEVVEEVDSSSGGKKKKKGSNTASETTETTPETTTTDGKTKGKGKGKGSIDEDNPYK